MLMLLFYVFAIKNTTLFDTFANFKRCTRLKLKGLYRDILEEEGVTLDVSDLKNYDLYYPCGYNKIEKELNDLRIRKGIKVFGICGCDKIASKSSLWKILEQHYGREKASHIMPESFLLRNKNQVELFSKRFNGSHYILKKNIQRKKGIKISNNLEEIIDSGKHGYIVVQEIKKSLLINKRAMNIRLYLLVECRGNIRKFYFHSLSKCLYTSKDKLDKDDTSDFDTTITNSYVTSMDIYKKNPLSLTQLLEFVEENFNYNKDTLLNDISLLLRKLSKAIMTCVCKCNNLKDNTMYQLFGIDILIDNKFKPYILEINKGPDMKPKDNSDTKLKRKVIYDTFFKMGLLKSKKNYRNLYIEIKT